MHNIKNMKLYGMVVSMSDETKYLIQQSTNELTDLMEILEQEERTDTIEKVIIQTYIYHLAMITKEEINDIKEKEKSYYFDIDIEVNTNANQQETTE